MRDGFVQFQLQAVLEMEPTFDAHKAGSGDNNKNQNIDRRHFNWYGALSQAVYNQYIIITMMAMMTMIYGDDNDDDIDDDEDKSRA